MTIHSIGNGDEAPERVREVQLPEPILLPPGFPFLVAVPFPDGGAKWIRADLIRSIMSNRPFRWTETDDEGEVKRLECEGCEIEYTDGDYDSIPISADQFRAIVDDVVRRAFARMSVVKGPR